MAHLLQPQSTMSVRILSASELSTIARAGDYRPVIVAALEALSVANVAAFCSEYRGRHGSRFPVSATAITAASPADLDHEEVLDSLLYHCVDGNGHDYAPVALVSALRSTLAACSAARQAELRVRGRGAWVACNDNAV